MFRILWLTCVFFLVMVSFASALEVTVNSVADLPDTNPNDYFCQASNGLCTLRAAIDEVNAGHCNQIFFEYEEMTFVLGSQLWVYNDVTIYGEGDGSTVIDAGGLHTAFNIAGISLTLKDLTIQNASPAIDMSPDGAVIIYNSSLIDNVSNSDGGAIDAGSGGVTLVNCIFSGNSSTGKGGAVYVANPVPGVGLAISGCSFTSNYASQAGGAVYVEVSVVVDIENSTFDGNWTFGNGGALAIAEDLLATSVSIRGCDITGNSAFDGGGLWIVTDDDDIEIIETNIGHNSGLNGGGVFLDTVGATVTIRDSSIYSNQSNVDGGGLKSVGSEIVEIVNSTFSHNEAEADGGGLYFSSSLTGALVYSSTITLNLADSAAAENNGDGGGIYVENGAGLVYFRNSILAENDDFSTAQTAFYTPDCYADLASEGYNLIGYANYWCDMGSGGPGDLVGDSSSGAIDPGLNIFMGTGWWPTFLHPLLEGSPAIDAGDPEGCYDVDGSLLLKDQVGQSRPAGPRCDIGSYERPVGTTIFSDGFESGGFSQWSDVVGS